MDAEPYRARLNEELTRLTQDSAASKSGRDPVELDQQSVGRLSRMDALQVQAMAQETERRRQIRIQALHAALKRIDEDEFGYCVACDEEIAEARLTLDPTCPTCIDCASAAGKS
jgi:DnaK suppressor protein